MCKILITLLLFLSFQQGFTQSFEGIITYSIEFEVKGDLIPLKDQIFEKLKDDNEYFDTVRVYIRGGEYKKVDNKEKPSSIIYSPEINNIYILQEDFEYVSIIDAKNISPTFPDIPEPEILEIDSVKKVSGIPCKTLKLRWNNMGEEWYFYNEETAIINPSLYKQHSYEYFNEIIKSTGAYPLEIIKSFNDMIAIRMTLISIEELQLSDEVFAIPELKKANKKMTNLPEKLLGSKVMKIKN